MARPCLKQNPKFRRLRHCLEEPVPHVIGYLECMWMVGYESGDPVLGDHLDVELAAEYPGERGKLFRALLECRLIDDLGDGRYAIHDLFDHAPEYVLKRAKREAERQAKGVQRQRAFSPKNRRTTSTVREGLAYRPPIADCSGHSLPLADIGAPPAPAPIVGEESPTTPLARSCEDAASEQPAKTSEEAREGTDAPAALIPAPASDIPPEDPDPVVLTFPCVGNGPREWHLRASKVAEYRESFPALDVLADCRRALQWCRDNPKQKKTARGMTRFLGLWLDKEQNRARTTSHQRNGFGTGESVGPARIHAEPGKYDGRAPDFASAPDSAAGAPRATPAPAAPDGPRD
jgi:hypothetical protein